MFTRISRTLALIVCTSLVAWSASAQPIRQVLDAQTQVESLKLRGEPMGYRVPVGSVILSGDHHWQGFVRHPDPAKPYFYAISSRENCTELHVIRIGTSDSKSGYRMRSNRLAPGANALGTGPMPADRVVNTIPIADTHGGGMQAVGNYLAIPLTSFCADGQEGRIALYDISVPDHPVLAKEFRDEEDTSWIPGAPPEHQFNSIPGGLSILALTQLDDGSYFLLGNYAEFLWMWHLSADLSTFHLTAVYNAGTFSEWPSGNIANDYSFQSFQLINDAATEPFGASYESLFLIGMQNKAASGLGDDCIKLFNIHLNKASHYVESMTYVTQARLLSRTAPDSGQVNSNFAAGGSVWISPTGALLVYGSEHYVSGENYSVTLSEYCGKFGDFPVTDVTDGCTAHVQLYTDANYDGKVLTVDALDYTRKNYRNLFLGHEGAGGFSNNVSSISWRLPPGCTVRLYSNTGFAGNYLDLTGVGAYANLAGIPWTSGSGDCNNDINSVAFLGSTTPAPVVFTDPMLSSILNALIPSLPCSMLKMNAGNYPGNAVINRRVEIRSTDGLVRIGGGS